MTIKTRFIAVLFICALLVHLPAVAEDLLAVYNGKKDGFLFKYPEGWRLLSQTTSKRKVTAFSPSDVGKLTVRLKRFRYGGYRDGEALFIEKYKRGTAADSNQFPSHHYHSSEDDISTYTFSVSTKRDHVDYDYKYRVLILPEYNAAVALETMCAPEKSVRECALLDKARNSFWIYNKEKFSQIFRSAYEIKQESQPIDKYKRFDYKPFTLHGR